MAEKKVSGKNNKTDQKRVRVRNTDSVYEDFLIKYGQDLRKRSTRTVSEPKKNTKKPQDAETARCGEINPHLAVNPAAEHHILTKRSERILADDTGFKAQDYYQRFEMKPEMPELKEDEHPHAGSNQEDSIIPGQQTMADMVAGENDEDTVVPVESKDAEPEEDLFTAAYRAVKDGNPYFGKSEKLRAIARTANDDVGMEPESQLSFPAFDPLFKFDEPENKKKKIRSEKKKDKKSDKKDQIKEFDIDEEALVTSQTAEEKTEAEIAAEHPENAKKNRKHRFFSVIDNGDFQEEEPVFEINSKQDIRSTATKLKKIGRANLIKTAGLLLIAIITGIISMAFSAKAEEGAFNAVAFTVINIISLILAGVLCIKELADGIKDILKLKFTPNAGCILILLSSFIQSVAVAASPMFSLGMKVLTPAVVLTLTAMTIPKLLLTNNSRLAVRIIGNSDSVSLFRGLSDGGIEGAVNARYSEENGSVRCNTSVQLPAGIIKRLTNAIPRPFGNNASYIFAIVFSLVVAIAGGIITRSFAGAVTSFTAMLIACLPLSYTLAAAFLLLRENNILSEKKSSIISYKSATEVTKTKAVILDASEITEGSSCSIHSIRTFGTTDPKKATLCCAAAIKAASSPLLDIIRQVVEQGEEEIPEADDFYVCKGGIAAIVDSNKVLLGTKEFLEENNVLIPENDYEEKHITGDRKLLFLSVNGEFCMLLIVSYHIRRSMASFFRYLTAKDIAILIHSSDPNINADYIEKKCKLPKDSVSALNDTESSYFRDKAQKTETSLEADVFTNGKPASLFALLKSAFRLDNATGIMPSMIFILALVGALAVSVPALLGSYAAVGSLYIIIIKIVCTVLTAAIPLLISKK